MARAKHTPQADGLFNRELSWVDFNARVLELAADDDVALLERVRFCAIFSANLDEFFRVRVAGLMDQLDTGYTRKLADGDGASDAQGDPPTGVRARKCAGKTLDRRLQPALAHEGIVIGTIDDCTPDELRELGARFEQQVYPVTLLATGPGEPFPTSLRYR